MLECEDWISTWRQLWSPRLFAWEDAEERNQGFVIKAGGSAVARQVDLIERDSLWGEYLASLRKIWKIHILSLNSRLYLSKEAHESNVMVFLKFYNMVSWKKWGNEQEIQYNNVLTKLNIWRMFKIWIYGSV